MSSILYPPGWTGDQGQRCTDALRRLPDATPQGMLAALDGHRRDLSKAHHGNEFLDIDLANLIHQALRAAWDQHDQISEQHRHWLALATAYFIDPDDGINDFTDLSGLDDDAQVVSSCLRAIGFNQGADDIDEAVA